MNKIMRAIRRFWFGGPDWESQYEIRCIKRIDGIRCWGSLSDGSCSTWYLHTDALALTGDPGDED